jgi:8-oxo-dGTP diphosphatase
MERLNPHISIDCVIFGFDGLQIRILVINRKIITSENEKIFDTKLPGDFIRYNEDLDSAARRVLFELTGLEGIYLKQFGAFGSPERISKKRDIDWLKATADISVERVVTVAYYSLIKIDESKEELVRNNEASWNPLSSANELAFDHSEIVTAALQTLREKTKYEPVGFELLPKKFTLRHLQNLYEAIIGRKLDNRNFRKKILKLGYLIPLEEKQTKVAHKPARMFKYDKKKYEKASRKDSPGFFY